MKFSCSIFGLFLVVAGTALAQPRFNYGDLRRGLFIPRTVQGVRSMRDGVHYTTMDEGRILRHSYREEAQGEVFFDAGAHGPRLDFSDYALSGDERRILLTTGVTPIYRHSFTAEYWVFDTQTDRLAPLSAAGPQQAAAFSPDGSQVAFVRANDLYVADPAAATERRITTDGRFNHIVNGIPDWVYEEEFGFSRAFAWSPDGTRIAWIRFDESRVREYNMNRGFEQLYPENHTFKYPKAGEENSVVEVWSCDLATGAHTKIDIGPEPDQYIPRIGWTPGGDLWVYRLNRPQNHFEVLLAAEDGSTRVIYDERNDRYVERVDDEAVTFLPDDDRFVVRSERDGFMHLYLHSIRRGFLNRITRGGWEVTRVLGVAGDRVWYLSAETSPLRRDLFSIRLDGRDKKRLTDGTGTCHVAPSEGFRYFVTYYSNATTPLRVFLLDDCGREVRVLEDNEVLRERIKCTALPPKEFFTFTTPEGIGLNGFMIKPVGFDPSRQYPLLMTQYSGPGSQRVADLWSVGWEDVLVQRGYIVACVDGRGTGFRGEEFKKCTYRQLGRYETEDQISAARWLGSLPYVDAGRIGIYGWSYGGFMALNCILKGNEVFRLAVSVAPVTSWRFYDTIYTELYNGDPNENPSGYDDNSPLFFADRLKGKLLIAHGTGDDNVHVQHTYDMVSALVRYEKPFELLIYPDQQHGMGGGRHHLMERCIEFVCNNL